MNKKLFQDILIISDMDGTLLNSSSKISQENLSAINHFIDNGGSFTVATGRMNVAVNMYIEELPLNIPAILYNGAMIYDFGKEEIVWKQNLEDDVMPIINWVLSDYPEVGVQIYSNNKVHVCRNSIQTEKHIAREHLEPVFCKIDEAPFPWIKCMLIADNHILMEIKEHLREKEISFRSVFSESNFLELLNTNSSKGNALKELIRIYGFSRKNVISLGDNLNDIELIQAAGTGIAVDNAHPELKQVADYCCCSNNDHAIAEVIKWIEEGKLKL